MRDLVDKLLVLKCGCKVVTIGDGRVFVPRTWASPVMQPDFCGKRCELAGQAHRARFNYTLDAVVYERRWLEFDPVHELVSD